MGWIRKGYTLLELLTVLSIISILLAILLPTMAKVRATARDMISKTNQQKIVRALNTYEGDYYRYPPSVAVIKQPGLDILTTWMAPMTLVGHGKVAGGSHRALSEYLRNYIDDPLIIHCPNAPEAPSCLKQVWAEGDEFNHHATDYSLDPFIGTYCLLWNYIGYTAKGPFRGPRRQLRENGYSSILVCDYIGYRYKNPIGYYSCEKLKGATVRKEADPTDTDLWSLMEKKEVYGLDQIQNSFNCGHIDGHVSEFTAKKTTLMQISLSSDGSIPWPSSPAGPGEFYLPRRF